MSNKEVKQAAELVASKGRHGDTVLAHINPKEAALLKALGGSGSKNPQTGLPEYWGFSIGPVGIGSDYGGISVGGISTGQVASDVIGAARDVTGGLADASKDILSNPAVQIAAAYYLPIVGESIATQLGVSQAVGNAIASASMQVAQGVPVDEAIRNATVTAGVQTGAQGVLPEVSKAVSNKDIANAIVSTGASIAKTAALGGSEFDIIKAAAAGLAGSAAYGLTDSELAGRVAAGGITGGTIGAATSAAGYLGGQNVTTPTTTPTPTETTAAYEPDTSSPAQTVTPPQTLSGTIASANLTPEERDFLNAAQATTYSAASTAQALPSTVSDAGAGASVTRAPFAANDPRFLSALQKNPELIQKFSEYTNSYGFNSPELNVVYTNALVQAIADAPPTSQYASDLRAELQKIVDRSPEVATSQIKGILNPDLSPVVAQEIASGQVMPVVVVSSNPSAQTALVIDDSGKTSIISTAGINVQPGQNVQFNVADKAIISPSLATATEARAATSAKPAIKDETIKVTPPKIEAPKATDKSTVTPTGPTPPAEPVVPTGGEISVTPPSVTPTEAPTVPLTGVEPAGTAPSTPPETKKDPLFIYSYLSKALASPLASSGQAAPPVSTTGLTAYRPAGEIESEETGKRRQDVWNVSSLRGPGPTQASDDTLSSVLGL